MSNTSWDVATLLSGTVRSRQLTVAKQISASPSPSTCSQSGLVPSVTSEISPRLLGRIAVLRPTVTDGMAWCVGLSVCHDQVGPRNHVLNGGPDPPWDWAILEERGTHWKYRDFLLWVVQKRLNRLICRLGCGLRWAEGSTSSVVFARLHQCALMARHIGTSWWVWLNRPSMAAMRPYDILLWPLVDNALKVLIRHQSLDFRVICECTMGHVSWMWDPLYFWNGWC